MFADELQVASGTITSHMHLFVLQTTNPFGTMASKKLKSSKDTSPPQSRDGLHVSTHFTDDQTFTVSFSNFFFGIASALG